MCNVLQGQFADQVGFACARLTQDEVMEETVGAVVSEGYMRSSADRVAKDRHTPI